MNTWRVKDTGHGSYQVSTHNNALPVYPFAGHDALARAEAHAQHLNSLELTAWPDPGEIEPATRVIDALAKTMIEQHPELLKLANLHHYLELFAKYFNIDLHKNLEY